MTDAHFESVEKIIAGFLHDTEEMENPHDREIVKDRIIEILINFSYELKQNLDETR